MAAIRTANGDIFRAAIANPDQAGMGTTITAIAVIGDHYAGRAEPNIDTSGSIAAPGHVPAPTGAASSTDDDDVGRSPR